MLLTGNAERYVLVSLSVIMAHFLMYLHVILHFPLNVAIVIILEILDFYANQCALAPPMALFQVIQMLVHVHLQVQHATAQI